jgi:hypothetical protein
VHAHPDDETITTTIIDVRQFVSTKLAALAQRLWATEFCSRGYPPATAGEQEADFFAGIEARA